MKKKLVVSWVFQIICVLILLPAVWFKFSSHPSTVFVFESLGMEPFGRYLIATIEALCIMLLLTHNLAATGAILTLGNMLGAFIAHASILGISVKDDGGQLSIMMLVVLVSALIVAVIRKKEILFFKNFSD